ncbi:MAG: AlpA family phage regulatory protein [Candidatus Symbiopectobacterium sp. Dall1.0]|nr:AlpA family phage regulatory protein [Candidatus Symbiopectobacterium sp. Dall1.0]
MNNLEQSSQSLDRTVRERECRSLTGLGRTTRYQLEKKGEFPSRRKLGGRAIGWLYSDIQSWLAARPVVTVSNAKEG